MNIFKNINVVTPNEIYCATITICNEKIESIIRHPNVSIDENNIYVLPGVIDTHVHFREPGLNHKENITAASKAAIAGGVTSIIDMPNTSPPLDQVRLINEKKRYLVLKVMWILHFILWGQKKLK